MRDIDSLCMNCFEELTEGSVCSECGFDNDTPNDIMYLPQKTVLQGKYAVGTVIKQESDAVSYSGYDMQLDKRIIIREFFPKGLTNRLEGNTEVHIRPKFAADFEKYKQSFYRLWTALEKMQNLSAVVPVYDVFEANSTAYAIIEYMDVVPLREYLLRNKEGYITWDNARLMFMPVLTTIEALHTNGIIHGSITPDTLVLCRDGKVRLTPFTITESTMFSSSLEFNVNEGYTALEQYDNSHKICNSTDIYSFSACIYRALVGTNPPPAPAREANDKIMIPNSIAESIPMHVIKAMGNGLQIYPEKRIRSVSEFRELLDAAPAVKAKAAQAPIPAPKKQAQPQKTAVQYKEEQKKANKKSGIAVTVLVILICVAIAAAVYVVKFSGLIDKDSGKNTSAATMVQYQVPNFINNGYTQKDVEENGAWNKQFKITFQQEYSTDAEEGVIFKQSVEAGKKIDAGSEIVLTVSKGIQTETIPDVGGLNVDDATKQLEAKGFKVSTVKVYNDGTHTKDTVKASYGMAPAAGEVVAVGTEVEIQVYGEVQTTTAAPTTEPTEPSTTNPVSLE